MFIWYSGPLCCISWIYQSLSQVFGMVAGWNPRGGIVFNGRSFSGNDHKTYYSKNYFSSGNSGNCQMVIRSSIILIIFILICLHIDNLGIFASTNDGLEKSKKLGDEKSDVRLESTLDKPDLLTLTPITDSLEVSFAAWWKTSVFGFTWYVL